MNKKRYKKASEYYEVGELDKALKECEKGISEDLKDSALLNLKGIILYQRGELEEAIINWNINRDFNDDELSKAYIKDSKNDEEKKILYLKGEKALKELKIDEAMEYFIKCRETSFNGVKVNTAISLCYFKKGMQDESSFYAIEALKIDKNYAMAKKILSEIKGFNGEMGLGKKYIFPVILVASIGMGAIFYSTFDKSQANEPPIVAHNENDKNEGKENEQNKEEGSLDIPLIKKSIGEKDVDTLYKNLKDVDKSKASEENLKIINEGEALLKTTGVEKFYADGREYIKEKSYGKANEQLTKAYELGGNHYLYPHIVYLKGVSSEKLSQSKDAIVYYEKYLSDYKDGDYVEEVLYNLALLNKDIDKSKSKKYANKLKKDHPKSIYNNNNIKGIVES